MLTLLLRPRPTTAHHLQAPKLVAPFFAEFVASGALPLAAVLCPILEAEPLGGGEDGAGGDPPLVEAGGAADVLLGVAAK